MTVLVIVVRFKIAHLPALACKPHMRPCIIQIFLSDEIAGAAAHHFFDFIAENILHARTDAKKLASTIGDQDHIDRGLEETVERGVGFLLFGNVKRDRADRLDLADRIE